VKKHVSNESPEKFLLAHRYELFVIVWSHVVHVDDHRALLLSQNLVKAVGLQRSPSLCFCGERCSAGVCMVAVKFAPPALAAARYSGVDANTGKLTK
jgi:hypothetical protein